MTTQESKQGTDGFILNEERKLALHSLESHRRCSETIDYQNKQLLSDLIMEQQDGM